MYYVHSASDLDRLMANGLGGDAAEISRGFEGRQPQSIVTNPQIHIMLSM